MAYKAYQMAVFNKETGDFIQGGIVTAENDQAARDKVVYNLEADKDLSSLEIVVVPLV